LKERGRAIRGFGEKNTSLIIEEGASGGWEMDQTGKTYRIFWGKHPTG